MEISAYDIKAYDIKAYDIKAYDIKAYDIHIYCKLSEVFKDNDQCVVDGSLQDFKNGTVKIVSTAIWFMKNHFKDVERFTLNDDSHIECERGKAIYKLRLAYDYILKCNQTWYENKFHAVLPSTGDSLYDKYKKIIINS
jgi:hypothetical protein